MMNVKIILRLYLGISLLWVVLSDALVYQAFKDMPSTMELVGTYKGRAFVLVSALLLGYLLRREMRHSEKANAALQDIETRYRDLFIANPLPMWVFESGTYRYLEVNNAAIAKYGYTREEFLKMTILDIRSPKERERLLKITLDRPFPYRNAGEWVHSLKDGTPIDVEIMVHAIDYEGRKAVLAVIHDITDRKNLMNEQLEVQQLRAFMETEVQLREWRDKFFAVMAHEVRTPLAVISAASSMLATYDTRLTVERRQDQYEKILRQVRRMTDLTDDIMGMLRSKIPTMSFKEDPINLVEMCNRIAEDAKDYLKPNQTCDIEVQELMLMVLGDEKLLARALENVVKNASKYTPEGGHIHIKLYHDDDSVFLTISDNGIGIPEADLPNIFTEFKRASNVGVIEGTGLGLAITKQAIELHHGKVTVHSKEQEGTVFTVQLPLANAG